MIGLFGYLVVGCSSCCVPSDAVAWSACLACVCTKFVAGSCSLSRLCLICTPLPLVSFALQSATTSSHSSTHNHLMFRFLFSLLPPAHLPPEVLAKLGPSSKLAHKAVAGEQGGPPRQRHHVANFGEAVPLGDTRHM